MGVVIWCSVNYAVLGNSPKIPSKYLQKCFKSFFIPYVFLFLLIVSDRVGRKCLCMQDLEIRGLQITQNNISHPKLLMINYIITYINFLDLLCWFKHAFISNCRELSFQVKTANLFSANYPNRKNRRFWII